MICILTVLIVWRGVLSQDRRREVDVTNNKQDLFEENSIIDLQKKHHKLNGWWRPLVPKGLYIGKSVRTSLSRKNFNARCCCLLQASLATCTSACSAHLK